MVPEANDSKEDIDIHSDGLEWTVLEVNSINPGISIASPLYDEEKNIVHPQSTLITSEVLKSFREKGIETIYYMPEKLEPEKDDEELEAKTKDLMDELLEALLNNNTVNLAGTKSFIDGIHDSATDSDRKFLNLTKLRNFDDYIYVHTLNVAYLIMAFAKAYGFDDVNVKNIGLGAFLRDVGMMTVPKEILHKKEKLTDEEFKIVKTHTYFGYKHFLKYKLSGMALDVILHHHERFDGQGYPDGLTDRRIPLCAKMTMACDIYDSLITERPYRKAHTSRQAMEVLLGLSKKYLNPIIITAFISNMARLLQLEAMIPVGSLVLLNTNEIAKVVKLSSVGDLSPVIQIISDSKQQKITRQMVVDLKKDKQREIKKIIPKKSEQ